jgi:hypothetical protein
MDHHSSLMFRQAKLIVCEGIIASHCDDGNGASLARATTIVPSPDRLSRIEL